MIKYFAKAACTGALFLFVTTANAGPIYGGSDLLDAGDVVLLEQWLGEGSMSLTNIFDKEFGDTARDFHAAVDGQGATFSIIEIVGQHNTLFNEPIVIGGYNPASWGTHGYTYTFAQGASRDAFIFNLSEGTVRLQDPTQSRGVFQTYNYLNYGPVFGGGFDIWVNYTLDGGHTYNYTYNGGSGSGWATSIVGFNNSSNLMFGQIEVFAVNASAVPEPGTLALLSLGIFGFVLARRSQQ